MDYEKIAHEKIYSNGREYAVEAEKIRKFLNGATVKDEVSGVISQREGLMSFR